MGVTLQTPPTTTAVSTSPLPGMTTVMVSPLVPVPLMVGVVSLVVLSSKVPLSLVGSSTALGASGPAITVLMGSSISSWPCVVLWS